MWVDQLYAAGFPTGQSSACKVVRYIVPKGEDKDRQGRDAARPLPARQNVQLPRIQGFRSLQRLFL